MCVRAWTDPNLLLSVFVPSPFDVLAAARSKGAMGVAARTANHEIVDHVITFSAGVKRCLSGGFDHTLRH